MRTSNFQGKNANACDYWCIVRGALSFATMQAAAQGMPNYDTQSYCRRSSGSGGSYSLENYCRQSENNDRAAVQRANASPEVWRYCLNLARSSESYSLLKSCIHSEEGPRPHGRRAMPPSSSYQSRPYRHRPPRLRPAPPHSLNALLNAKLRLWRPLRRRHSAGSPTSSKR